jgi:hypothetical protein
MLHPLLHLNEDMALSTHEFANRLGIAGKAQQNIQAVAQFRRSNPDLDERLEEYCWRLVGIGFLVPRNGGSRFKPTERGKAFLEGQDPTAIISGGLDAFMARLGFAVDDAPRFYARLAQSCFLQGGHYEASIVMVGSAAEALARSFGEALDSYRISNSLGLKPRPRQPTASANLNWLDEVLREHHRELVKVLSAQSRPTEWIEPLRSVFQGTAQAIRFARNEYGHPTGFQATHDQALELLTLFPRFGKNCVDGMTAIT